ncbi:hypothetical protein AB205_0159050 [Aquarana catesbeiana]|uniref:Uncharacterized protein n=1 Tax=Aquarana catesbeiana TaxID=8400 RepID=A0A2G9P4A5_AQUCT|nr:hypothetical protein AB205_0159050 [Aquarana catesbeiana]
MAVPAVDTKGCQTPAHQLVNMKRIQMDRDLQTLIEKQNRIHSAKMNTIRQSHGCIDNWNYYSLRSLNTGQRRQNLSRITQENSKILERILKRQSEYGKWVSEWEKVEQIRTNISRYQRPAGPDWAGWQRSTFMDVRRDMDIQHSTEESEVERTQMGPAMKLKRISQAAGHRRMKESSIITDRKRQFPSVQTERSRDTTSWESSESDTGQPTASSLHRSRASNSSTSKKTDHTCKVRYKSRNRKLSNSESDCNASVDVPTGRKSILKQELDENPEKNSVNEKSPSFYDHDPDKTKLEENRGRVTAVSNKYAESEAFDSDSERKTPLSYSKSDQDFSSEQSDTSSCYSLQDSEDGSSPGPSQSPEVTEALSTLSLNLKTRAVSPGTSQKSSKSSVTSVDQIENPHSTSRNASRNSKLSSEGSKRSHYRLPESTKTSPGSSSQMTNRSHDSTSLVTNRIDVFSSQGASMRAFSRSSASSSTYRQGSPDDATQNTYRSYEEYTRDSSQTPGSSAKTFTGCQD